jgi:hypothetical protein
LENKKHWLQQNLYAIPFGILRIAKPLPPIMKRSAYTTLFLLITISSIFSQNGTVRDLVEKADELNLDMRDLTTFAEENIKDKEQLARFFYYWIGTNIKYDHQSLKEKDDGIITLEEYLNRQDEYEVYENKKGVCAGYSNLFQWFMDEVEIKAVTISGHIRDERNHFVELNEDDFRHAWNAIKLNGKWILVDTTWGTSNNTATSDFYFNIKPEYAIITHFPEDSKWQLLENPLSLKEFNKSPFVKPIWFMSGFTEVPKLLADEDYYYYVFEDIQDNQWLVGLNMSSDNLIFNPIKGIKAIDQDGMTYLRFKKLEVPDPAYFKVKLGKFENQGNDFVKIEYNDVINFRI